MGNSLLCRKYTLYTNLREYVNVFHFNQNECWKCCILDSPWICYPSEGYSTYALRGTMDGEGSKRSTLNCKSQAKTHPSGGGKGAKFKENVQWYEKERKTEKSLISRYLFSMLIPFHQGNFSSKQQIMGTKNFFVGFAYLQFFFQLGGVILF